MTCFTDTRQFVSGLEVAEYLDNFYRRQGWSITPTAPREERVLCLGDRHYRKDAVHYYIEYKSGLQTYQTGNVFLETISVDTEDKPGWVYTCQADFIFYAALLNHKNLIFVPSDLRLRLDELKVHFPVRSTGKGQNKGYRTWGVCVPLTVAEQLARKVTVLP